jgi:hypothetical protein
MYFPLIHPHGEDGWHTSIPLSKKAQGLDHAAAEELAENDADDGDQDQPEAYNRLTQRMWIAYHIHLRRVWDDIAKIFTDRVEYPILLRSGRLFQEYLIDFYAQTEACRLRYIALNQTRLRADSYRGLTDALDGGIAPQDLGKHVILPSSFSGGPRAMQRLFQDAMGVVRVGGSPSLFITMTCDPKWKRRFRMNDCQDKPPPTDPTSSPEFFS